MRISDWSSDVCSSDLLVDVDIVEHHHRGMAAEFHGRPLHTIGGQMQQLLADRRRAGERDFTDHRRGNQVCRNLARIAVNQIEHVGRQRSEEHTSELQSLMRISYAVFCLKKKTKN